MSAMPPAPQPPILPDSEAEFTTHLQQNAPSWYQYCRAAYEYIRQQEDLNAALRGHIESLSEQAEAAESGSAHFRSNLSSLNRQNIQLQGIIDYKERQYKELHQQYVEALVKQRQTRPMETMAQETPHLSERLPDPDRFDGDRKDLRRFVSQIREKMNVNQDRFNTPSSRMAYVTNRLHGMAYNQILPYIHKGICQLNDYDEILAVLERAYGDADNARNARNELFRLKQGDREFSLFFAEFHRLALEGEVYLEGLPHLLEQSINRELKAMMKHHDPPKNADYLTFARFLQDLENRRIQFDSPPAPKPSHSVAALRGPGPASRPSPPVQPSASLPAPAQPQPAPVPRGEPMDLSLSRRAPSGPSRRDKGECFRCGSKSHLVRDCSLPDTRPAASISSVASHPVPERSGSPLSDASSGNGASLA